MRTTLLQKLKLSPLVYLLILASIVYSALAVVTYHPDNKQVLFWASLGGVALIDPWKVGAEQYPHFSQFNYPPAHYLIDKVLYFIAQPLAGSGYTEWLSVANEMDRFTPELPRFAFATKAGLLLLTLATGYLVYLVVDQLGSTPAPSRRKQALVATALWLFNPITLYSIPMMGQNDVIAIFVFLLGWLAIQKRSLLATVLFDIGASIKMIPLIWVPFLLISHARTNWKKAIAMTVGASAIYMLTLAPFISDPNFQKTILTGNHNQRFLLAQLSLGFSESINIVPALLLLILAAILTKKTHQETKLATTAFVLMTVNLIMLSFTHFHPQWWSWVVIFWSIWISTLDRRGAGIALVASTLSFFAWLLIVILFKDAALNWGMLTPLANSLGNLPPLVDVLVARGVNAQQFINLAYTWLAGVSLVCLVLLFQKEVEPFDTSLEIPGWLRKLWQWVSASKLTRVSFFISTLALMIFGLSLVAHAIPAPRATKPPTQVAYQPLKTTVSTSVAPKLDGFDRFDLYLRNPDLSQQGKFEVRVLHEETLVHQQTIAAGNIGSWSLVRFDIPEQLNSAEMEYFIEIAPDEITQTQLATAKEPILVGTTRDEITQTEASPTLAVRPYFAPSRESLISQATVSLRSIVSQNQALFTLLILASILFI